MRRRFQSTGGITQMRSHRAESMLKTKTALMNGGRELMVERMVSTEIEHLSPGLILEKVPGMRG